MFAQLLKLLLLILVAALILTAPGCYYMQAAGGQFEVLRKRESIDDVIGDPSTPPEIAERLRFVQEARAFSISDLGLPNNKSYRTYSDLERDYVVWNVFAAEEFSLTPKLWCYPIAGCVSYRGYFKQESAEREADKLGGQGLDVHLGGVSAYSTLGNFNDPVLSTMMRWDDVQLASVLFHELAHQLLYVKDDSGFNESFASAVEEFGIERFLLSKNMSDELRSYENRKAIRRQLMKIVSESGEDLSGIYAQAIDDDDKRRQKQQRIERLNDDLRAVLKAAGRNDAAWFDDPFNNARIASMTLYDGLLPAFRIMLDNCVQELTCFYDEARRISELERAERERYLDSVVATGSGKFDANDPLTAWRAADPPSAPQ
jgi:predicted aminopeptidase